VLTDGASAIYGTDAIAGVINFIMRKDFTGVEATAYYGDSEQGGGARQHYNIAAGWGDLTKDKFNAFVTVDYQKQDNVRAAQRNFSKSAYIPDAAGGVRQDVWLQHPGQCNPARNRTEPQLSGLHTTLFVWHGDPGDARPMPLRLC
jgi:outer membrane receptor protein involved in Fe transport